MRLFYLTCRKIRIMDIIQLENKRKELIVRIENDFLFNAFFHMYGTEYSVLMYCVSLLDPASQDKFEEQIVPAKDILRILQLDSKKHWGSRYDYLRDVSDKMVEKTIRFRKGYKVVDKVSGKTYKIGGGINWFQHFLVMKDDETGEVFIKFRFSEILGNALLHLKQYVSMSMIELDSLTGGHIKHLYTLLKTYRSKLKAYETVSTYRIEVNELKQLLGIKDKYDRYKDFNRRILKEAEKQIEDSETSKIAMSYKPEREGRSVKYVVFKIWDKKKAKSLTKGNFIPTAEDTNGLSFSQRLAYLELVEFGVFEGIAFKQLIPTIKGSEFVGFEDYFVKAAIAHFKKTSKKPEVGVFVNWWHEQKIFDVESDVWSKILEGVVEQKKKLEQTDPNAFDNRLTAKTMTYTEFVEWYRANEKADDSE